jgi:hypothetical protein
MADSRPAVPRFAPPPAARQWRWSRLFLLLLLLPAQHAVTADLREISVELIDKRYHLTSKAWFAASRRDMYRVLTDYDLFVQFSSAFVETRNVPDDEEGRPQFFTRVEGCILLFCKTVVRQGYLLLKPHREIVAIAAPEASDFSYSRERWRLEPSGHGTLLYYDFEMEPAFWVPPVIGPFVIKRKLKSDGAEAIDRIEALALGRTPKP